MGVFIVALQEPVLEMFKQQYNTENYIQLKNILTGILSGISNNLGMHVWMDGKGTIRLCENEKMFNHIKDLHKNDEM
jgi:hypothetical protein